MAIDSDSNRWHRQVGQTKHHIMAQVALNIIPNILPLPPPVLGPQPDFGILNDHIQGAAHEIGLLQNLPAPAIQQELQHLRQQSDLIINHLQQLTNTVLGIQNIVAGIQNTYLLPSSF